MLKRNDLAKQFEIVVQQEIKNHNDQMLATNISINSLRESIEENKRKQQEINSVNASLIEKINISCTELSSLLLKTCNSVNSLKNDFNVFSYKLSEEIKISVENSVSAHSKNELSKNRIVEIYEKMEEFEDSLKAIPCQLDMQLIDHNFKIKKHIECIKKEILDRPSEVSALKDEISQLLESARIDKEGIQKELLIYKKSVFVLEKHIENLYTQIERLKAGKECHKKD